MTLILRFSTSHLVWLFWTAALFSGVTFGKECLQIPASSSSRKSFYVDGKNLPITIEVSDRVSHQLTSNILAIILDEVIHYDSTFVSKTLTTTETLQNITGCHDPFPCGALPDGYIPDTMVNMEMWLTPGFNLEGWVATNRVEDAGPLGLLGRTNWYISEPYVNCTWETKSTIVDHWRAFQDRSRVRPFDLFIQDKELIEKIIDSDKNDGYCTLNECQGGVYEPEQCENEDDECATLLADYPTTTFTMLKDKIDALKLFVRVAWVGAQLDNVVSQYVKEKKPVLFYNWKPNTLTSLGQFTAVAFPQCENDPVGCSYGVNQLQKVAWSKLKENAPVVFALIRNIKFTHDQYLELLKMYQEEDPLSIVPNPETVACQWLNKMEWMWNKWIPVFLDKEILYVGGIFPLSGNYWQQKGVVTAAQMAVDAINRNANYSKDYLLELRDEDGACSPDVVMKSFITYITHNLYSNMVGILGPACSDTLEPIVGVARHYHTIIISYSAEGSLSQISEQYPYFFRTIPENNNFRRLAQLIKETQMNGTTGTLSFEGSSRRLTEVVIWQWRSGRYHAIGKYTPQNSQDTVKTSQARTHIGQLTMNHSAIVWMNPEGRKPEDGTVTEEEKTTSCPVEDFRALLNVRCDEAIAIANVMGFFTFITMVVVAFILFKRRYDRRVKVTEDRMRELGLMTSRGIPCLDEWEMPRDHIVINRKIGEGAFGMVYGGEAVIGDKGWVGVAVKTLKIGATMEEKLDFLSEAEMMKRFDHVNIVRLLGVCTVGEPVYTVMEFMLYGDLKTYLLARRHLVNEKDSIDCMEVSSRHLTAMALDIARGLSYLANLKYVHRDLACRNCLVNAGHVVKIADFGMCRPMYDSDYYKFNKRGMLPVRWMAPESLMDGIFTSMSDVWSYGVVLYEIITFGSFPYQGLSNNQVLEHVKGLNTLPIPKGCNAQLEQLLMSCWHKMPQQRPQATEIVEILANHADLISPCLDLPLASVELEGTDSLEITIPKRKRLHSVSSVRRKRSSVDYSVVHHNLQPRRRSLHLENGSASGLSPGLAGARNSMPANAKDYVILHLQQKELRRAKSARSPSSHRVTKL